MEFARLVFRQFGSDHVVATRLKTIGPGGQASPVVSGLDLIALYINSKSDASL